MGFAYQGTGCLMFWDIGSSQVAAIHQQRYPFPRRQPPLGMLGRNRLGPATAADDRLLPANLLKQCLHCRPIRLRLYAVRIPPAFDRIPSSHPNKIILSGFNWHPPPVPRSSQHHRDEWVRHLTDSLTRASERVYSQIMFYDDPALPDKERLQRMSDYLTKNLHSELIPTLRLF